MIFFVILHPMAKKKSKKKNAEKTSLTRRLLIIGPIILLLIAVAAIAVRTYIFIPHEGDATWVRIPGGASEASMRDSITRRLPGAEGQRIVALLALMGVNPSVSHGAYRIEPGQTAWTSARKIARGLQTPVKVTWNNVRTLESMADAISKKLEFSPAAFLLACEKELAPEGFDAATLPAAFLPDSYEFYWGTQPEDVVRKLYAYRTRFWNQQRLDKAAALGLTPVEVATVASIVEEETAKADERPAVARLYLNRIEKQMPLQADPTVKFAIGDFSIRRITHEMLRTQSPYNTYLNPGLPPGPIRVPSKDAIDAVLDAPAHDYLYMCAKEDFSGYHNFAVDYPTHMANARRYQNELNRRNIK